MFIKITGSDVIGLGLTKEGHVWTWGSNSFSYYEGAGTKGAVPVWNSDGSQFGNIKEISVYGDTCMAIDNNNVLWAWGGDEYGQLGTKPPRNTIYPQPVVNYDGTIFNDVISVSTANYSTFAVKKDGTLWAWGNNYWGSIGDGFSGSENNRLFPVKIKYFRYDIQTKDWIEY